MRIHAPGCTCPCNAAETFGHIACVRSMASSSAAPARDSRSAVAASLPAGSKVVGDYEITAEDQAAPKQRGYTTRAKEEARRTEVKFTGLVRRWERRWVPL